MQPINADDLSMRVEFFLSAKGLPKLDLTSNTDPFAVVFFKNQNGEFDEIGRTDVVMDTQEPVWTCQFLIDYKFEEVQQLRVEVYDEDAHGVRDLHRHDFVGRCDFTMSKLMGARGQTLNLDLKNNEDRWKGHLTIRGEQVSDCADIFQFQFHATRKLAKKDGFFGKSDPFICISRTREDGSYQRVWQSEVVDNNLTPVWRPARIGIQKVCNGDIDRPLRMDIYDMDSDGSTDYMGSFSTSIRSLVDDPTREIPVIEEEKLRKRNYHDSGAVACRFAQVIHEVTFLDFVRGGCEISMMVGIDFTASNGMPSSPTSLHFIDPSGNTLNEYQHAILSVGSILQDYDYDRNFPVYGFGGRVGGQVSHCFPVFPEGVQVHGVEGIMHAYQLCMENVSLAGPTLFAPLIQTAIQKASNPPPSQQHQRYDILLIICDGIINDMVETIDQIVVASHLPLSIIIIGVGSADFSDMDALDADDGYLVDSRGNRASRDIVQFVPFRQFAGNPAALAAEVLKEVPGQVTEYFKARGIEPNDAVPPPAFDYTAPPDFEESKGDAPPAYNG
jgi:hypothetical protein